MSYMLKFTEFLLNDMIIEGVDVDVDTKIVTFNDTHEYIVDTSLTNNPTKSNKAVAVFRRKRDSNMELPDGNPLLYAMKGMKGWKIGRKDLDKIWYRIDQIIDKLSNEYDVVVMPGSNSGLVSTFSTHISKKFKSVDVIHNCFLKRTLDEVIEDINWVDFNATERDEIKTSFKKMRGNYFEAKHFPKHLANKFEASIFKTNPLISGTKLVGQRILVLDDVVSSGLSLSSCARTIQDEYFPKSITNIVLFSEVN